MNDLEAETDGRPTVSPIVGVHVLDPTPTFIDGRPCLVKLEFHEDGTVTYKRLVFGRHA